MTNRFISPLALGSLGTARFAALSALAAALGGLATATVRFVPARAALVALSIRRFGALSARGFGALAVNADVADRIARGRGGHRFECGVDCFEIVRHDCVWFGLSGGGRGGIVGG